MRRILLLLVLAALSVQAFGQEVRENGVSSYFSAEIGLNSGFSYEQRLGHSFTLHGRIGYDTMLWGTVPDGIVFQGIFPAVRLSPRWYYSASKMNRTINTGGYLALEISYTHGRHGGLFTGHWNNAEYESTVNILQPTWGYNWAINNHWAVKSQVGLSFGQINQGYIETAHGRVQQTRGWNALVIDLGVIYVF